MSWKNTITTDSGWRNTIKEEPGLLETGLNKLASGASMGFLDELAGGLEAAGTVAGLKGLGGNISDISMSDTGPTLDLEKVRESYVSGRDLKRKQLEEMTKAHPELSIGAELGGALLTPGGTAKTLAGKVGLGAAQGAAAGLGYSEAESPLGVGQDVLTGGALGAAVPLAVAGAQSGASKLADYLGKKLGKYAESSAIKATGATGAQASKFRPETGRELLDQGLIQMLDTPEVMSERLTGALNKSGDEINSALSSISDQAIKTDDIVMSLSAQVDALKKNPAQAPVARQLESIINDIKASGESTITPERAEEIKRAFNISSKNWMDPEKGLAGKAAYRTYRDAVETAAKNASSDVLEKFQSAKKQFGLLSPVQEAAEKRAQQLAQSPVGGLNDIATVAAGGGGFPGIIAAAARKSGVSRLPSTIAVGSDKLSKLLQSGKLGQFSAPIQNALSRGPAAVAATDFLLQQTKPEYRKMLKGE